MKTIVRLRVSLCIVGVCTHFVIYVVVNVLNSSPCYLYYTTHHTCCDLLARLL